MSVSAAEAAFVRELVYKKSAIVLGESQQYLIETRLEPVAVDAGFKSVDEMVRAARGGEPSLQTKVVEALTTNETSFFRDLAPFECLERQLMPGLIEARAKTRALTIWSAACSTGQEPYSIAMLLAERFPVLSDWNVRIVATDFASKPLERARAGRYRQVEMNRGLPAAYMTKYFERTGTEWEIKPAIRKRLEFSQVNLAERWSVSRPDVVFLRNVLIYFDSATKKSILERMRQTLPNDGALFLGAAETTLNIDDHWERVPYGKTAFYRPQK